MSRIIHVIFFFATVSILTGCLSGPLPEDMPKTTASPTPPPLDLESLTFVSFDSISFTPDPEFTHLFPQLDGLEFLPHLSPVDVMTNDLSVLNHSTRLQILASITGKQSAVYVKSQRDTDFLVYYTVYKLNDTKTAANILEAYKGAWNKRLLNISGAEIWIWDGYLDEIAGRARPLGKDSVLYWDTQSQTTFLSQNVLPNYVSLSKTETDLFSVHGETAYKEYFIMIDVKAELEDIQNRTDSIFSQVAEQIFKVTPPSSPSEIQEKPGENVTIETAEIEDELRLLLESYLAGNITKEEYDSTFEDLVQS
jgi:hypothetical protein